MMETPEYKKSRIRRNIIYGITIVAVSYFVIEWIDSPGVTQNPKPLPPQIEEASKPPPLTQNSSPPVQPKVNKIPFEVVRTWASGKVIVISSKHVNQEDMQALGQQLVGETYVDIFDNKRAATVLRQASQLSSADEDFRDQHNVGFFKGRQLVFYLPGIPYPNNERIINY
jgi:hypothetical protein